MAIVWQNNDTLKCNALQLEANILKHKNKTLSDLCAEYSSKYRALISKTTIMELENRSLKEELEKQNEINRRNGEMCMEYEILKQSMNNVQSYYDKLLLRHKELQEKYKSAQYKIRQQMKNLNLVVHKSMELELKYNDSNVQLLKNKSLLNQQNIAICNLKAELELECNNNNSPLMDNLTVSGLAFQRSLSIRKGPRFSKTHASNSNVSITCAMVDPMIYPRYSTINEEPQYSDDFWTADDVVSDDTIDIDTRTRARGLATFNGIKKVDKDKTAAFDLK